MQKAMYKTKKIICILMVIMLAALAAGCGSKENKPDTKKLTVTVVNRSDVDTGMFSIINPLIDDQINVGAIAAGEFMTIETDWPVDCLELKWALYNVKGELCIDATTDITEAKDKVTLSLTGEGTIDNVEASF